MASGLRLLGERLGGFQVAVSPARRGKQESSQSSGRVQESRVSLGLSFRDPSGGRQPSKGNSI